MAIANELSTPYLRQSMALAVAVIVFIALTPFGAWLESRLFSHVLLAFPLLVFSGMILGVGLERYRSAWLDTWNAGGIPGILLASFALAFWMIPRWLDASLIDPLVASMKYLTLVVFVGIPIATSWPRMHSITRGVVKIEFLTMLWRLGWLYLISPERLCNSYLIGDQIYLAWGFLLVGSALAITWLIPVFFGQPYRQTLEV